MTAPLPKAPGLSKSRFISGRQCELRLWNEIYHRDLATPTDAATQAIFDQGNEVGAVAQKRHPGGVIAMTNHREQEAAIAKTAALMGDPSVPAIFEAAFRHQGVFVAVDMLVRVQEGWDLIEVKSSTSLKEVYRWDLALQHWVLAQTGLSVHRAGVLLLNTSYVYEGGELEIQSLFSLHDDTDQARARAPEIAAQVAAFHAMLGKQDAPGILPGPQCSDPYECPFLANCTKDRPAFEHTLGELSGIRSRKLDGWGLEKWHSMDALPEDADLNDLQARILESARTGQPWVSPHLGAELARFQFPVYHLDFETFALAIPRFPGTRPFQAVPVQWSCHREAADGALAHTEFLSDGQDPQRRFAESLLKTLGDAGSICVYSNFEARIIRELAQTYPDLAGYLNVLLARLVDLLPIVRANYYHPAFHGSFSIKAVLPVLVPNMSYDHLEVGDGQAAGIVYNHMLRTGDTEEGLRLRAALLTYCAQDTLAMVEVRRALEKARP